MNYLARTPWWLKKLYPSYVWDIRTEEKDMYLSFDDGPHETITPFVLDELSKHGASASFFCIGSNVEKHPAVVARILAEGHTIGNHTHTHLNGWKTESTRYLADIRNAAAVNDSPLFRPPYGRILRSQARRVPGALGRKDARIVMWDVLSGDFDVHLSREQCLKNVTRHANKGSIIVFHDSEKAFPLLSYALPRVLEYFSEKGYRFKNLSELVRSDGVEKQVG